MVFVERSQLELVYVKWNKTQIPTPPLPLVGLVWFIPNPNPQNCSLTQETPNSKPYTLSPLSVKPRPPHTLARLPARLTGVSPELDEHRSKPFSFLLLAVGFLSPVRLYSTLLSRRWRCCCFIVVVVPVATVDGGVAVAIVVTSFVVFSPSSVRVRRRFPAHVLSRWWCWWLRGVVGFPVSCCFASHRLFAADRSASAPRTTVNRRSCAPLFLPALLSRGIT